MTETVNCLAPEIPADIETARAQLHACKEEIEAVRQEIAPGQEEEVAKRLEGIRSLLPVLGQLAQEKILTLEQGRDRHKWAKIGHAIEDVFAVIDETVPLFSNPDSFYAVKTIEEVEVLDLQMRASRKEAYERLGRVIEGLQEVGQGHPLGELFDHYLEGEINARNGCRTPDILMAGDAEMGGEIWRKSQSGDNACGQIMERNHRLDNLVDSLFQGKDSGLSKGIFRQFREYGVRSTLSPLFSAELNPRRTYLASGAAFELLVPYTKQSKGVIGAELEVQVKFGFDNIDVTEGDLKTVEGVVFPLLFESGYSSDHFSLLGQFGVWLSASHLARAEQEVDPYSENPLENGHLRLGIKSYLGPIRLAAGYQRNPWGDSFYFEAGVNIRGREKR